VDELAENVFALTTTGRVVTIAVTECAALTLEAAHLLDPLLAVLRAWYQPMNPRSTP
jgi:hypothetical protein